MRLDHIAYRVKDRWKTAKFFMEAFGYRLQTEFDIDFPDGSKAKCIALEPPEKPVGDPHTTRGEPIPWTIGKYFVTNANDFGDCHVDYHLAPEIFISDGTPDSIVGQWVAARNGVGGIHHLAYMTKSVEAKMKEWKEKGYAEFTTEEPMRCPGITQVFSKPSELTGVIYEFIERGTQGFCQSNVKDLMISTQGL